MRNLIALLWKYQFFVLFVVLEIISLSLLFNSYSYHRSLAFNAASDFTGSIYQSWQSISDYFSLKEENEILLEENARLRNAFTTNILYSDSSWTYKDSLYRFIPATVISNSVTMQNNHILINRGAKHGLKEEMGVISSLGIAGIVTGVSNNYAVVMSMLHQNSRISARIKKNGQLVNAVWPGTKYETGLLTDIPSHIVLQEGDTIVTSGNSLIFPENILIGTVLEQKQHEEKALGEAIIIFSTDFNRLQYVYVIENLMKDEQKALFNTIKDE